MALSVATYIIALSLGTILSIVQPRWDKLKEKALPGSVENFGEIEHSAVMKQSSRDLSHNKSWSTLPGSQGRHILPLTKEHESSDVAV